MRSARRRRARTPLGVAAVVVAGLALIAVVVTVLASTVFGDFQLFGPRSPTGAARAATHAIADGDAGALARTLDRTGQMIKPNQRARRDAARAAITFFRGWEIEGPAVRDLGEIDDGWYLFHFVIRQRSTGRRATVRANLVLQHSHFGAAYGLGALWIPGPNNHHNKSIL